jgi:hypothetical protein
VSVYYIVHVSSQYYVSRHYITDVSSQRPYIRDILTINTYNVKHILHIFCVILTTNLYFSPTVLQITICIGKTKYYAM